MSVYWTRGSRAVGSKIQLGVVIVRPGWCAFLPLFEPISAFEFGSASVRRAPAIGPSMSWQGKFHLEAWWAAGERAFDDLVVRAAHDLQGLVLGRADGEIAVGARGAGPLVQSAADPNVAFRLETVPPPELLAGWERGVVPFDAKKTATGFAVMSAALVLFAGGCGTAAAVRDEPLGHIGTVFWAACALAPWVAFFVRRASYRREMVAKAATRRVPYR